MFCSYLSRLLSKWFFSFPRYLLKITFYSNISPHCWLRPPLEVWETVTPISVGVRHRPTQIPCNSPEASLTFNKMSLKPVHACSELTATTQARLHLKSQCHRLLTVYATKPIFRFSPFQSHSHISEFLFFRARKILSYPSLKSVW